MKPQTKTLRVEWNGKWRSRKSDLVSVLGYEWIDFITYDPADNHKELSEGLKELDAKVEDKKEEVKNKSWW